MRPPPKTTYVADSVTRRDGFAFAMVDGADMVETFRVASGAVAVSRSSRSRAVKPRQLPLPPNRSRRRAAC